MPASPPRPRAPRRSEEHTSELQSQSNLVCRLLLEKKKKKVRRIQLSPSAPHYVYLSLRTAPATPEIYTLSLHDALPIFIAVAGMGRVDLAHDTMVAAYLIDPARRTYVLNELAADAGLAAAPAGTEEIGRAHV